jgi:hypothetical protein
MGSGKIAKAEVNDLPHLNLDPIRLPRQVNRQKRREILCAREAKSTMKSKISIIINKIPMVGISSPTMRSATYCGPPAIV